LNDRLIWLRALHFTPTASLAGAPLFETPMLTLNGDGSIIDSLRRTFEAFVKLLRTIPGFVRLLVGLFLVAQFAGVVSSPRSTALPLATVLASHDHHHHTQNHADHTQDVADQGKPHDHHDHGGTLADTCCALHAYFPGVLPPVMAIATENIVGESLSVDPDKQALGVPPGRLDRPPRPLR
jgi:hypothetical protein